jgi:protein-disulfide isomerase
VDAGVASFEFRHIAFLGEESARAAEAAECANLQGRFWDYHDLLFLRQGRENSGAFSESNLIRFGEELADASGPGTWDQQAFEACVQSGDTRAAVIEESRASIDLLTSALGQATTPSFSINGEFVRGLNDVQVFRDAIERAREQ